MALAIGQVVDNKYKIVRLIGEGGMGAVYEGENTLIRRRVAIKVLLASSATNAEAISRFEREAQAAGRIGSDHILEVLDLGSLPNGDRYMVMEYLDGETLTARIASLGRMSAKSVAPLARQFLSGLAAAHAAGIIHRDLKPDNIFILREKAGRPDFVKLIDFGISKFAQLTGEEPGLKMTRVGAMMGTPCYMSPEQARGSSEADVRTDIYACGVILYEAVTGRVPFDGNSFNDLMFKIALSEAVAPEQFAPNLDPDFAAIVMKAMAREPSNRYQTVEEFARALDDWMREHELTATLVDRPGVAAAVSHAFPAQRTPGPATLPLGAPYGRAQPTPTDEKPWARSHSDAPVSKGHGKTIGIAVAAVAVLGLAGGGFAMMHKNKTSAATSAPDLATAAASVARPTPAATASAEAPSAPSIATNDRADAAVAAAEAVTLPAAIAKPITPVVAAKAAEAPPSATHVASTTATPHPTPNRPAKSAKPTQTAAPDFGY